MSGQQQYEGYWDYMGRRLREESIADQLEPVEDIKPKKSKFNDTLTLVDEHMVILAEECGELTQACMKVIRKKHFDRRASLELTEEIGDVLCMINKVIELNLVDQKDIDARIKVKEEKLKIWSTLDGR